MIVYRARVRNIDPFAIPPGQHIEIPPVWETFDMGHDDAVDMVADSPGCMFRFVGKNTVPTTWGLVDGVPRWTLGDRLGNWEKHEHIRSMLQIAQFSGVPQRLQALAVCTVIRKCFTIPTRELREAFAKIEGWAYGGPLPVAVALPRGTWFLETLHRTLEACFDSRGFYQVFSFGDPLPLTKRELASVIRSVIPTDVLFKYMRSELKLDKIPRDTEGT